MKNVIQTLCLCCTAMIFGIAGSRAVASASTRVMMLTTGWHVTQDVRQLGEKLGWYKSDFVADWQPIDRLVHLQLLLAPQAYFGRELRYFNEAPWWYRLTFSAENAGQGVTLRFGGVDYFAKVWLNGKLLGEHEGYADPFEYEVEPLLRSDCPNVLVVMVSSPWDHRYANLSDPAFTVVRNLQKGSYEHADTFVQRDVNPIGIWRPVKLIFHGALREIEPPHVLTHISNNHHKAMVEVAWPVFNSIGPRNTPYTIHIRLHDTAHDVATAFGVVRVEHGANVLDRAVTVPSPQLWTTWDRGKQPLYDAVLELGPADGVALSSSGTFGIRTVELRRSASETRFFLNGRPLYLRGTTYWPDLYLSNMSRARYERDIRAAMRSGVNAFRVHVHTENPEFYELCDELGIVVVQDNDLNWVFPTDPKFSARAVQHFGTVVKLLRNHPSVIAWVAMNEVFWGENAFAKYTKGLKVGDRKILEAKLVSTARDLDPTRPIIGDSGVSYEIGSGDTHDYRGSLAGGNYFDIFRHPKDWLGSPEKLITEFGVDAPPAIASLRAAPEAAARLSDVLPRVAELQDYQYHLIKYYIEYYRIHKYHPNAGYFQFMWIDFSPQSFYGLYDYWGRAKQEGLGGGLRAMEESNQPVGIFMEHDTRPRALYAVNDTSEDLGECIAHWRVTDSTGVVLEGAQAVELGADGHVKIREFSFPMKDGDAYTVVLELVSSNGRVLASNSYVDPFQPQPRPKGYPERMDEELGMRLWWAGEGGSD